MMCKVALLRRLAPGCREQFEQVLPGLKTSDLQVTHGGSDRGMAHQRLNGAQVKAGFEQVRGKAVAQRVDAVTAGDPSLAFGLVVDLLRPTDSQLALRISSAGEQPGGGPVEFPVQTEFFEQSGRKQGVTILGAFCLLDADHLATAIDVCGLQIDDLADAQTGGVSGHQQDPVLGRPSTRKEPLEFLTAEQDWERLWFLARRQRQTNLLPTDDLKIEKAKSGDDNIAGAPGECPLDCQMEEIGFDLFKVELVRRSVVIVGERSDSSQVGLLSSRREAA